MIKNILEGTGRFLESDESLIDKKFIEQYLGRILVVIILLMGNIQLRYDYENCIYNIGKLKAERNDVRYTSIEKWGILTGKNRPEVIRQKVASSSVNLIESDEPPIKIK